MNNFELIDDYLANRLKGADREAFENQLGHDPALKSDVDLQRQIVEGIRQARVMELKSMLSKVPVGGTLVEFSVLRIAAGVVLAGVVSAAAYYYYGSDGFPPIENAAADVTKTDEVKPKDNQPEQIAPQSEDEKENTPSPEKEKAETKKPGTSVDVKPAVKPSLEIADPSSELSEENKPSTGQPVAGGKAEISPAHVQVEMDSSNKKYNFHYQFTDNKLMLYGSFDRSLYEVLEINTGNHALFLFYKNNFYLLDETQEEITKLDPIEDQKLLKKLREYRSR